jgi:hypothetical protein
MGKNDSNGVDLTLPPLRVVAGQGECPRKSLGAGQTKRWRRTGKNWKS